MLHLVKLVLVCALCVSILLPGTKVYAESFPLDQTLEHVKVADTTAPIDFADFQMLIVASPAVGTYLVLVFNFLGTIKAAKVITLPHADTTMLAAFALGHGAYLMEKAAGNVGES